MQRHNTSSGHYFNNGPKQQVYTLNVFDKNDSSLNTKTTSFNKILKLHRQQVYKARAL